MKKCVLISTLCLLFSFITACSDSESESVIGEVTRSKKIKFTAGISKNTRASETEFDEGDEISVFAVNSSAGSSTLKPAGYNYADNRNYVYRDNMFTSYNPVSVNQGQNLSLAYYAVYPYSKDAGNSFNFAVKSNQTTYENFTLSDLCTSYHEPTIAEFVDLEFYHRLSRIEVVVYGENIGSSSISMRLNNVKLQADVNLNDKTFTGVGEVGNIEMGELSTNNFYAILPPQTIAKDENFLSITVDGSDTDFTLEDGEEFRSGFKYVYKIEIVGGKPVIISGHIKPWDEVDDRLDDVVPEDIQEEMGDYIPIYRGVNPPNVEGTFFIDPFVTVYCEDEGDGGYSPGTYVVSNVIKLSNQDNQNNTVDYASYGGTSYSEGLGAFISGDGDNFTAFFNTYGTSEGIETKTALVISGTVTSEGIKDLVYAFVMVEKGDDPDGELMDEGVFRVFKDEDGLSVPTTWERANATRSANLLPDCKSVRK